MDNCMLSIVVSCYNKENEICRTLQSVLVLLPANCELLVIDDASKDLSSTKIATYLAEHSQCSNVHFFRGQKNRGISRIRNVAMRLAKGEYIHYLDGDDCFEPGYLANLLETIQQYEPDITSAQGMWRNSGKIRPKNGIYHGLLSPTEIDGLFTVKKPFAMMERYLALGGSQVMFRKKACGKARFVAGETMFEDFGFYFQWVDENVKWLYFEGVRVVYDDQPLESLSRKIRINTEIVIPNAFSMAPTQKIQKYLLGVMLYSIAPRYDLNKINQFIKKNGSLIIHGLFTKHGTFAFLLLVKRYLQNAISLKFSNK